jgi:hypothetical protein
LAAISEAALNLLAPLQAMISESGGRIFLNPDEREIEASIETMENDQHTQYLMDFIPTNLVRDRSYPR